ncbi:hypothetical protein NC652_009170 [Populus alba x Populus x berolinensis]|nr:hypothetical protein NC652_009170 [Populus alba x Populus x berolinensis]
MKRKQSASTLDSIFSIKITNIVKLVGRETSLNQRKPHIFFTNPSKSQKNPKNGDNESKSGTSMLDSEDCLGGFMGDRPLFFCGESVSRLSLRETLRASVGVMGESPLGMTEKVVLLRGKVYALRRFRALRVRRREFGKRIER